MAQAAEYRRELRQLITQERTAERDRLRFEKEHERHIARLRREILTNRRATQRLLQRVARRRAILEGRLSS